MDIHTVVMQVTDACPFDCPQCYTKKGNTHLSLAFAKNLLAEVFQNRQGLLQITGGEPLIYPHLEELILFCHNRNIEIAIATSGYGCSISKISLLKKLGVDYFFVSLNGSTRETHEKTRQAFDSAIRAIKNAKAVGLPSFVNWVACKSNADDFENVVSLCKQLGVGALYVLKKHLNFLGNNEDYPNDDQIKKIREFIINHTSLEIHVERCFVELMEENQNCFAGNSSFYVNCYGTLSPCAKLNEYKYTSFVEMQEKTSEWKKIQEVNSRCCNMKL